MGLGVVSAATNALVTITLMEKDKPMPQWFAILLIIILAVFIGILIWEAINWRHNSQ